MMSIAKAMGMPAPSVGLAGPAQLDFSIAGAWTGFAPPQPSGKIQIHDATAELQGILQPLLIDSATVTLAAQTASVNSFLAGFKDGPSLTGSATFPLHCANADICVLHFDLHSQALSLSDLNQLTNPLLQNRPWYHLLEVGQRDDSALMKVRAQGRVSLARMSIGNMAATNVSANLELKSGALSVRELKADLLGGHHEGNWDADFTSSPPKFYGSGSVSKLAMAQVSTLMHDPWATGNLSGQYTIGLAGLDRTQLRDSATGSANFDWSGGSFRHVAIEGKPAPYSFSEFHGEVALRSGGLICQGCNLISKTGDYEVVGHATLGRDLDVRLERSGAPAYAISGPLNSPTVTSLSDSQMEAKQR
jgi:hypothetical protein